MPMGTDYWDIFLFYFSFLRDGKEKEVPHAVKLFRGIGDSICVSDFFG